MTPTTQRLTFEQFLASQRLEFPRTRLAVVERTRLPPIARSYEPYQTQAELWEQYRRDNAATSPALLGPRFGEAVRARVYRAWPSLAREHHLYLLLRERYDTVLRTPELDQDWGIDYLVLAGHIAVAVHAYVDTRRSRAFRACKRLRHGSYASVGIQVDLPLDLRGARRLGEVAVYSEADLWPLEEAIELATA